MLYDGGCAAGAVLRGGLSDCMCICYRMKRKDIVTAERKGLVIFTFRGLKIGKYCNKSVVAAYNETKRVCLFSAIRLLLIGRLVYELL